MYKQTQKQELVMMISAANLLAAQWGITLLIDSLQPSWTYQESKHQPLSQLCLKMFWALLFQDFFYLKHLGSEAPLQWEMLCEHVSLDSYNAVLHGQRCALGALHTGIPIRLLTMK